MNSRIPALQRVTHGVSPAVAPIRPEEQTNGSGAQGIIHCLIFDLSYASAVDTNQMGSAESTLLKQSCDWFH